MRYINAVTACYALISAAAQAAALDYPVRTVRVVVPGPPGGGADILTRAVVQKMAENLEIAKWAKVIESAVMKRE